VCISHINFLISSSFLEIFSFATLILQCLFLPSSKSVPISTGCKLPPATISALDPIIGFGLYFAIIRFASAIGSSARADLTWWLFFSAISIAFFKSSFPEIDCSSS